MLNHNKMSDADLVIAYQSGDGTALTVLVKRWHKTFCSKSFWIVKDAEVAKDVAQDSWNTIILKLSELKNPERFNSWALRIVYNKSMDVLRFRSKNLKDKEKYQNEKKSTIDKTESKVDNTEIKIKLLEAINALPIDQQNVIKLFYVEEYALKEISELLRISIGTVKSRLFHAREKLKSTLKEKNEY